MCKICSIQKLFRVLIILVVDSIYKPLEGMLMYLICMFLQSVVRRFPQLLANISNDPDVLMTPDTLDSPTADHIPQEQDLVMPVIQAP